MLFIKKIVNQDKEKELAFQFGPTSDFLHMDCTDTEGTKYDFFFFFETISKEFIRYNGKEIQTKIHYNSEKKESRFTSELKKFIFEECRAEVGDLIILKRKETTQSEYNNRVQKVKFDVIRRKNKQDFTFYKSILDSNMSTQSGFSCVITETDCTEKQDLQNESELNIIFYGAPGTGKSTKADNILNDGNFVTFRTTFHPESDYFSFVGSYKPYTDDKGKISYRFVPQVFLKAYLYAWTHPDEKVCLDIEEINRGNCAQIFGDIFQLLDRKYPEGCSNYFIDTDTDCANYIESALTEYYKENDYLIKKYKEDICRIGRIDIKNFSFSKILLPSNFYIYATMNTSDQSLYPMDSAFKRRWTWKYVPIDYNAVKDVVLNIASKRYSWSDFLRKINARITELTQSEDKQLGPFFIRIDKGYITETEFRDKVLFYLWNDIYKDEYGTATTIFRITDNEGKDRQVAFSSLFENNSSELMGGIINTVGVSQIEEDTADKDSESQE